MTEGAELILSKSSIEVYLDCHYKWFLGYVYRVKGGVAPDMSMAIGHAVHAGVEAHWKGKADPENALRAALIRELALGPAPEPEAAAVAVRDALTMLRVYLTKIAPTFTPGMIERDFLIRVNGQLVSGRIDAAEESSDEVHDTKTTSTPSKVVGKRTQLGMTIYRHGYKALTGRLPKRLVLDVVARNGRWKQVEVEPDDHGMAEVVGLVSAGIIGGQFEPTGARTGSCARCPFFERECSFGRIVS